jgi:hypothetical protein
MRSLSNTHNSCLDFDRILALFNLENLWLEGTQLFDMMGLKIFFQINVPFEVHATNFVQNLGHSRTWFLPE